MSKLLKMLLSNLMMHAVEDGTGGTGDDEAAKAAAEKAAADAAKAKADEEAEKNKSKTSDAEAKLLKEVMEKKESLRSAEAARKAAEEKLAQFEGLDPAEMRKLVDERKKAQEKELEAKGQWETLKKQMGEAHAAEVEQKEKQLKEERDSNATLRGQIAEMTVGQSFQTSKFISEEMSLTATKARVIYGSHFEFKDGKVVAFDKPATDASRSMLVDSQGDPIGFEDAIQKIVKADPEADHMLKSKSKTGAGSKTAPTKTGVPAKEVTLTGISKIAAGLKARSSK